MGRGKLKTRYPGSSGDLSEPPSSYRGKRGRGGCKGTRGRLTRGGKTYPVLAQLSAQAATPPNDVDQESSCTDEGRHRDENDYVRTVVVTAEKHSYFGQVSVCLICGSIGKDAEGTMVSCATCAQSYHTFCVGLHDKLNSTIVKRGWRCLDCTVCEGCGEGRDESKLLLCDECDVSCHIYCLSPKLEEIPKGPWRCKWCSMCRRCSQQIANGVDVSRMEGLCETCFSLRKCPKCNHVYEVGDHIIKCQHCSRWLHGKCEDLYGEEMLESASENGFRCSLCRPQGNLPLADSANLMCDYVAINKCAVEVLHSRNVPLLRPHSVSSDPLADNPLQHFMPRTQSFDDGYDDEDVDSVPMSVNSGRGRGGRGGGSGRRTLRLGIGGFFVKLPRHRMSVADEDANGDEDPILGQKPKLKRPRKPRRSQLEDNYPPSIQDAFFGLKPIEGRNLLEMVVEEPSLQCEFTKPTVSAEGRREVHELSESGTDALREGENFFGDLMDSDLLEMSDDLDIGNLDMITDLLNDDDDDGDGLDVNIDDSSVNTGWSVQSGQSPFLSGSQQDVKIGGNERFNGSQNTFQNHKVGSQQSSYPLHTNISQSGSRSNSQMDDCVERVNQATERWEEDEPLGDRATKAAVLYANINYAHLKEQHPLWNDRVKQIHRIWRCLDAPTRQEYVNKARENRAHRARPKKKAGGSARTGFNGDNASSSARPPGYYYPGQGNDGNAGPLSAATQNAEPPVVHLSKEVFDNYSMLQRRSNELNKYQQAIETDLLRMRKQKKNLIAKRRQLNKNSQQRDAQGDKIEIELNETDKQSLETLATTIVIRQKDLENCKRDIKQHSSNIRDFEVKNNIPHDMYAQSEQPSLAQPPDMHMSMMRPAMTQPSPAQVTPTTQDGLRPPPPYPSAPSTNGGYVVRPAFNHYQNANVPMHSTQFVKMENGQQMMSSNFLSQSSSGSAGSGECQGRGRGSKKRKREEEALELNRPRVLGGVVESSLVTPEERMVFDVLDNIISQVVIMIDGADAYRKSGMLKKLLESQPGSGFMNQRSSFLGSDLPDGTLGEIGIRSIDAPKAKKKRTQIKKMSVGANNEYELLLARIKAQLGLCSPLPRNVLEPLPRNDRTSFTTLGVTDLTDCKDKMPIVGEKIGDMRLVFMDDYYTSIFKCPFKEEDVFSLMSDFCREVNTKALLSYDQQNFSWREDYDVDPQSSKMDALLVSRRSRSPRLPGVGKIGDVIGPVPPHRSAFFKKLELDRKECSVNLIIEGVDSRFCFDQLMALLDVKNKPDFQLDTPPRTPEINQASNAVLKTEPEEHLFTCRYCGAFTKEASIKQSAGTLGITPVNEGEDEVAFCSLLCYFNFAASAKIALSTDDLTKAERFVDGETLARLRQISADHFAKSLNQGKVRSEPMNNSQMMGDPCASLLDSRFTTTEAEKSQLEVVHLRDLALLNESISQKNVEKKWRSVLWRQCDAALVESFERLTNQVRQKQLVSQLQSMDRPLNLTYPADNRKCELCSGLGDGEVDICGRLINVDANIWVHVNCAIWSQEVFESTSGALKNVKQALLRASDVSCALCGLPGASVRCYKLNCDTHYHLPCARQTNGRFMKDKIFFCGTHDDVRTEMALDRLAAFRRLYVEREENELIEKLFKHDGEKLLLRVGSLLFQNLGQLLPDQLKKFHNADFIFPVGYTVTRFFWSTSNAYEKLRYKCAIREDKDSNAVFTVSFEANEKRICKYEGTTASAAWERILKTAEATRDKTGNMLRLFPSHATGETLFGLNETSVSKMIESLPGVDQLATYTFKHGGSPLMDLPLAVNPSGCARCEPRFRTLIKNKNKPHHRSPTAMARRLATDTDTARESRNLDRGSRASLLDLNSQPSWFGGIPTDYVASPYARFEPGQLQNSTIYSQYQKMKKEWKNNVYLARSRIQGLGLYASKNIEMNSMIIEYKGELIRNEVCEMREKKYEAQNRGVYMFRIDAERLIDATMAGGPARYINHSCDPNCSTCVVTSGTTADDKKIIIIANRPISAGEELTYDYQFDIEDDDVKIPCLCGAPNCRKWMN